MSLSEKTDFDFDTPIDRKGTASAKWDKYKGRDILPLWVADMDFASPPVVIEALHQRVRHGIFGYSLPPEELVPTIRQMLEVKYSWKIDAKWLVWLPGVVTGLNAACRAVGDVGDEVLSAVPVYPPFLTAPTNSGKKLVTVPLIKSEDRWQYDFDQFEKAITPQTRLFLLCSPHNPVGRSFTATELVRLSEICAAHDVIICSDEIHCDLILDEDIRHIPTATLSTALADRTITLMAASKTYNIPGLGCAFAVISNDGLRRKFKKAMAGIVPYVTALGFAGTLAAYRYGGSWQAALLAYLRANRKIVTAAVDAMPGISMTHVEATYLAWLDVRDAGLDDPVTFFEDAGVGLSDGREFGGPGFVRLNFGCPQSLLRKALQRMGNAF